MANYTMSQVSTGPSTRTRRFTLRQAEGGWGLLFITPWIIGFILFQAFPMIASLLLSFTNYQAGAETGTWIGLDNYSNMMSLQVKQVDLQTATPSDALDKGYNLWFAVGNFVVGAKDIFFWRSVWVTLKFALFALPTSMIMGLLLAILANLKLPAISLFRTIYFMPYVIPAVAVAIVWRAMLDPKTGWVNASLKAAGIIGPDWLSDERWTLIALTVISLWGIGNAMILYLGGLQSVPTELYEAAKVDGANAVLRFWRITLPMISPVILYNLIIGLIGTFQYFVLAYILSNNAGAGSFGGPGYSMYFYNLHLYLRGFRDQDMGYASAMAWMLVLFVLTVTTVVFASSGKWVFYQGARRAN
jgi:multiple sugar transport system permease protein